MEASLSAGHSALRSPLQPATCSNEFRLSARPTSVDVDEQAFEQYFNTSQRFEARMNTIRTLMSISDYGGPASFDSLGGSGADSNLLMSVHSILQSGHAASADAEGMIESAILQSLNHTINTAADASESLLSASVQSERADESCRGIRHRTSSFSMNIAQNIPTMPSQSLSLSRSHNILSYSGDHRKGDGAHFMEKYELLSEYSAADSSLVSKSGAFFDQMPLHKSDTATTSSLSLSEASPAVDLVSTH
jgi:hypothetical protein